MKVSEVKKLTYPINNKPCIANQLVLQYISFKKDKENNNGKY